MKMDHLTAIASPIPKASFWSMQGSRSARPPRNISGSWRRSGFLKPIKAAKKHFV